MLCRKAASVNTLEGWAADTRDMMTYYAEARTWLEP